jgi:RNA polymerase sigma factor (sigma-70 family)
VPPCDTYTVPHVLRTASNFFVTKHPSMVFPSVDVEMRECDITLTAAAAQNDTRLTFDAAFAAHHRLVYRYACALTRDAALAEDVTQEVFLRLHGHIDAAQNEGMLRPWLLRVTANVASNTLRTRRRAAVRDEAFGAEMLQMRDEPGPDETLAQKTEMARAQHALAKLREPLRSCLLLRHEGLSYREIAGALGLKESSIGTLIARGRDEFMKAYKKVERER